MTLTIVIVVKNPPDIDKFIEGNQWALKKYDIIVIDSGGGEKLSEYAGERYIKKDIPFWEARKLAYKLTRTDCILNLDVDVIIPLKYIDKALSKVEKGGFDVVSIFYEDINHCQGALEYGISLWKASILRELYDYSFDKVFPEGLIKVGPRQWASIQNGWCECTFMWRKLKEKGYKMETLPYRAIHLKKEDEV